MLHYLVGKALLYELFLKWLLGEEPTLLESALALTFREKFCWWTMEVLGISRIISYSFLVKAEM